MFALGGFTDEAQQCAETVGVALFSFDLMGTAVPENTTARVLAPPDRR